jgi:hypothetical protein
MPRVCLFHAHNTAWDLSSAPAGGLDRQSCGAQDWRAGCGHRHQRSWTRQRQHARLRGQLHLQVRQLCLVAIFENFLKILCRGRDLMFEISKSTELCGQLHLQVHQLWLLWLQALLRALHACRVTYVAFRAAHLLNVNAAHRFVWCIPDA